MINKGTE